MFAEEIARAIMAAPRDRLAALSAALWKGYSAGAIPEEEAQRLAEVIETRKAQASQHGSAVASQRHSAGSRAKTPASVERRRSWAASSWLPPRIASRFTPAEQAALGVVMAEIALTGRCELVHGAVAGRAGVSISTVKRAMAEARKLGLVLIEVRRITRFRNDSNIITVLSAELKTWVATRGRGLRAARQMWDQGGGVHVGATSKSISFPTSTRSPLTAREQASRKAGGDGGVLPGPRWPAIRGNRRQGHCGAC